MSEGVLENILPDSNLVRRKSKTGATYKVYGKYKGYYVSVSETPDDYLVKINYKEKEKKEEAKVYEQLEKRINEYLEELKKKEGNIISAVIKDFSIQLHLVLSLSEYQEEKKEDNSSVKIINRIIDGIIQFLEDQDAASGCQMCGSEKCVDVYNINYELYYLCADCFGKTRNISEENSSGNKLSDIFQKKIQKFFSK